MDFLDKPVERKDVVKGLLAGSALSLPGVGLLASQEPAEAQTAGGGITSVDTIAALKALDTTSTTSYPVGTSRVVAGYYAAGDNAGVRYYRLARPTTLTADNGGTVIRPNTGGGQWELMWDGSNYNVCWSGADPSLTDNRPYFAAAKAALDNAKGGTLWVPVGTYALTPWALGTGIRLIMRGLGVMTAGRSDSDRGSTLLLKGGAGDLISLNAGGASTLHNGPHIYNMNFQQNTPVSANQAGTGRGIYSHAVTGGRLIDCVFMDFNKGVHLHADLSSSGPVDGTIPGADDAWWRIEGCHFYDNEYDIYSHQSTGGATVYGMNKFMHKTRPGQWAIWVDTGPQFMIHDNKFDVEGGFTGGGIHMGGYENQIHDNQFEDTTPCVEVKPGAHNGDGYGNMIHTNRMRLVGTANNGTSSVARTGVVIANDAKCRYTTLIGNIPGAGIGSNTFISVGASATGTYRRDALAPNG